MRDKGCVYKWHVTRKHKIDISLRSKKTAVNPNERTLCWMKIANRSQFHRRKITPNGECLGKEMTQTQIKVLNKRSSRSQQKMLWLTHSFGFATSKEDQCSFFCH